MALHVMSSPSPSRSIHHRTPLLRHKDRPYPMADPSGSNTLTPQRKHHKLLKDGSEVWSDDVERIFVEGLKEYWESPWATYSRGRSRWRNQFLVEHLQKHGIERTKKQVASHIQVLRNMWRGEKEFHLVAGGEELFLEDGLLAQPKPSASPEGSLRSTSSSPASTPEAIPQDYTSPLPSYSQKPASNVFGYTSPFDSFPTSSSSAPSSFDIAYATSSSFNQPISSYNHGLVNAPATSSSVPIIMGSTVGSGYQPCLPTNKVVSLNLWAEGMTLFNVDIDQLFASVPNPQDPVQLTSVLIRIKVAISSIEDLHSSPNLHGFQGAVTLANRWSSEARCITTVYCGPTPVTQEKAFLETLQPSLNSMNEVTCGLPDSALTRCKWLQTNQQTITQQIVVDGVVTAVFVYHLERTISPGTPPSAEIVAFRKYRPSVKRQNSQPSALSMSSPTMSPPHSPHSPSTPFFSHTSKYGSVLPPESAHLSQTQLNLGLPTLSNSMTFDVPPEMYHHPNTVPKYTEGTTNDCGYFPSPPSP
ncbi:hypothetical protein C8Q75DRAFT_33463 [Abortiporus biennis]|nr:hypothetical protein C8Q75DRAFT_33463 [Abortiporus biennis]